MNKHLQRLLWAIVKGSKFYIGFWTVIGATNYLLTEMLNKGQDTFQFAIALLITGVITILSYLRITKKIIKE